jgi:hypothetical protein
MTNMSNTYYITLVIDTFSFKHDIPYVTSDQALAIIRFIDQVHQPYYWSFAMFVAFAYSFESYLPSKIKWESRFDSWLSWFKLFLIGTLGFITIMQGVLNGCLCQIPQNYLAQKYLNKEYWYPFGVVFRENFSSEYWPLLRFGYLVLGGYFCWTGYQFWHKRMVRRIKQTTVTP